MDDLNAAPMAPPIMIIMLSGYLQSGKDTVGNILCERFDFRRVAFADALKNEVSHLHQLDRKSLDTQEGKKAILHLLPRDNEWTHENGEPLSERPMTVRDLLIRHGQQKRALDIHYWVDKAIDLIRECGHPRIVITDWRFPNEWSRIVEKVPAKVVTWRIQRWKSPPLNDITETALDRFAFDDVLFNHLSLYEFEQGVKMRMYAHDHHGHYGHYGQNFDILVTDVDDVLLKWIEGFKNYVEGRGYRVRGEYPSQWNMIDWIHEPPDGSLNIHSVDESIVRSLIMGFNSSSDFGKLEPYPEAIPVLQRLRQRGIHIVAVSSCMDTKDIAAQRRENLVRHFGDVFDVLICLPLAASKLEILSCFGGCPVFVDDNPHNVEMAASLGYRSRLMKRPWNLEHCHLNHMERWDELEEMYQ